MNKDIKKEKLIPELRFKEFKEEWTEIKLSDIGNNIIGLTYSPRDVTSSEDSPIVLRSSNIKDNTLSLADTVRVTTKIPDKLWIRKGDILICTRNGSQRLIGKNIQLNDNVNNMTWGAFMSVFRSENNDFNRYLFETRNYKKQVQRNLGARINQITTRYLNKFKFLCPREKEEQQKISSFLSLIDKKIELLNKKKELLEIYKKGIMHNIFNRDIRFKDSNGNDYPEWEEKRLGEIGKTYNGLSGKNADDFGDGSDFITYKQIFDNSKINTNRFGKVKIHPGEKQTQVKYGDIFFTTSSETPGEVGFSSALLDEIKDTYLNSFCFGFRPNSFEILFPQYARFFFKSTIIRKIMYKLAQGSTRFNMSKEEFMKETILLPKIEEQKQIADYLQNTDQYIEYQNRLIILTNILKKGLLQKMFI